MEVLQLLLKRTPLHPQALQPQLWITKQTFLLLTTNLPQASRILYQLATLLNRPL